MEGEQRVEKRGRGRPQLRSDGETRHLIHEAAIPELLANGYAGTSMEAVAVRAGVSTKTLYRLFPTKAELFVGISRERLDQFFSKVTATAVDVPDLTEALTALLLDCAGLTLDPEVIALNRLVIAECERFPEIAEIFYNEGIRRVPTAVAAWLTAQRKRGAIRVDDPKMAAGLLIGMMISEPQRIALLKQGVPQTPYALKKRARICAEIFLDGCRVR